MLFLNLADHPFPEGKRLGMRIIDAKDAHTLLDPEIENALQFLPQRPPLRALEIQRIDILILLRRILGILYRAVRTLAEPFRMLAHVGMIRRALKRDIERDLESVLFGFGHEPPEIFQRAEFGMNGLVTAFRRSDGPRTADISRLRLYRIVLSFPKGPPDRMNWRKIDDVETHGCDVGKPCLAIAECSVTTSLGRAGSRKYFVPSGEARLFAVDYDANCFLVAASKVTLGIALNECRAILLQEQWLRLPVYLWLLATCAPSRVVTRRHRPLLALAASSISSAPMSRST